MQAETWCDLDPKDKNFDKKKNVALNLNKDTGLYEINKNWQHYASKYDGLKFANLKNYESDDEGNLLVADGGVSYNYDSSKWKNEGNDGIAYYAKDGKYYAEKALRTEVKDFSEISDLPVRYGTAAEKELCTVVDGTGEWIIVNFYIHTGNESKNYRLEVFSGDREGNVKNTDGSYLIIDNVERSSIDSKFTDLIDDAVETAKGDLTDEEFKKQSGIVYYAYSFYDSPEFLRYNSESDVNGVGNKYTSYDATSYSEGVAYFETKQTESGVTQQTMFVDYSYSDVTVTADSSNDDTSGGDDDAEDEDNGANILLLASSIILAVVLVLAIISLAIRKFLKKSGRKPRGARKTTSQNTAKRRYKKAEAPAEAPKEEPAPTRPDDENDPYND